MMKVTTQSWQVAVPEREQVPQSMVNVMGENLVRACDIERRPPTGGCGPPKPHPTTAGMAGFWALFGTEGLRPILSPDADGPGDQALALRG